MRVALTIILTLFLFIEVATSQQAIQVFSKGTYIHQMARYQNKIYVATDDKGAVIYDMPTSTYSTLDVSNSPMNTNDIYGIQVLNSDTLLVSNAWDSWLVTSGIWHHILSNNTYQPPLLADNGRIFYFTDTIVTEFINGGWQKPDSVTLSGFYGNGASTDFHNHIFCGNNEYINSSWKTIPLPDSSGYIVSVVWDELDTEYALVDTGTNGISYQHLYQLIGNKWKAIYLPQDTGIMVYAVANDPAGNKYIFLSPFNYNTGSGVMRAWSVSAQKFVSFNLAPWNSYGMLDAVFYFDNNFYCSPPFDGLMYGNFNNGFTRIDYGDICVEDRLEAQADPIVESRDSFYIVDGNNNRYLLDSSLTYCRILDTVACPKEYQYNFPFSYAKDWATGDVWGLNDCKNTVVNFTTGQEINLNNYAIVAAQQVLISGNIMWVYSSLDYGNNWLTLIVNGIKKFKISAIKPVLIDNQGNLWFSNSGTDYNEMFVYMIDTAGKLDTVREWYCYYEDCALNVQVTIDNVGNPWIQSEDTLIRYNGLNPNYKIVAPAIPYPNGLNFQVFDSTEAVLVSWEWVQYYYNGIWSLYPAKFVPYSTNYIHSYHDGRLLIFTQMDGILIYNLNADWPLNVTDFPSSKNSVTIFPQPFSDNFKILLSEGIPLPATVNLIDMTGRTVASQIIQNHLSSMYTNTLANGVYVLYIRDNSGNNYCIKCVKEY